MSANMSPLRHPEFYFEDGNLVILVEGTLFRVFRSSFTRHSAVWRELFLLPEPAECIPEGLSDDSPLFLSGISSVDFERLLWIIYPPRYGVHNAHGIDAWVSILDLAIRWEFADIRALAIRELQSLEMSAVDKIILSRRFDIRDQWAIAAYVALCERPTPLTLEEANRLGIDSAVRIAQLREQLRCRCRSACHEGSGCRSAAHDVFSRRGHPNTSHLRADRVHWEIAKIAIRGDARPSSSSARTTASSKKASRSPRAEGSSPRAAKLVAEAFGLNTA
ncbi:uncharacterized protein LAESUDRAFT_683082 [Laetiporus sulphureus 93-53]|uniref:BTB domain-containing protein n=1 Tax=Laetiporus sulphureus 93-53 TaxID=1314785 RepID=A0A165D0W5_9APHY|nr:uncharacterized protein LAESUDRAFT_683082 [Laetiporus sulphureus 93-53]KZT03910.1 hypothetical protein LAESUDRAFT_683082 [Laetiporus sulphureus 93-53]